MKKNTKYLLFAVLLISAFGGVLRMLIFWSQPEMDPSVGYSVKRVPRRSVAKKALAEVAEKTMAEEVVTVAAAVPEVPPEAVPKELTPGTYLFRVENAQDWERLQKWADGRGIHGDGLQALWALRLTLSQEDLDDLLNALPELAEIGAQEGVFCLPEPPVANAGGGEELNFYGTYRDFLGVNSTDEARGQGVKIALIDTAVLSHGDFEGLHISALTLDGKATMPFAFNGGTHATSVLSILAGNANGITSEANILSIPIVGADGTVSEFDLATAIVLAVDNGADVISISLGGETGSSVLEAAVRYATDAGAVIVAAAGNDGVNRVSYPAAYGEVVAVGAVNRSNQYMDFSNSGETLNVVAPGVGLETATADNEWTLFSGTSAAVPCVAGVIANYLSSHPQDHGEDAVEWLETTATDIGIAGQDENSGQGSVDAWLYENHDVAGLTDVALTAIRVETTEDGLLQAVMNVQNKGTADLEVVNLLTRIGKVERSVKITDLKAYEALEVTLPISVPKDATTTEISGMVMIPDGTDLRPENQGVHAVLNFTTNTNE